MTIYLIKLVPELVVVPLANPNHQYNMHILE